MFGTAPALQWAVVCAILDRKNRIPSHKLGEGPQIYFFIIIIIIIIIITIVIANIITTIMIILLLLQRPPFPVNFLTAALSILLLLYRSKTNSRAKNICGL